MHPRACLLAIICLLVPAAAAAAGPPITLAVDLTEAPRRVFHVRQVIPARPGPLALAYPKWIPGEHGPTGPIANVVGLRLAAGGKPVAWQRDPVELHVIHCQVPAGQSALEVVFDFVSPSGTSGFAAQSATSTHALAVLSWNAVLFYPAGAAAADVEVEASVRLPAGWRHGSALHVRAAGAQVAFRRVSLDELVDSPVLAGAHFRTVTLDPRHFVHLAADSAAALAVRPETVQAWKRLVAEASALFGPGHYRGYHFLVSLTDGMSHFGLEHHESSDNRMPERTLVDDEVRPWLTVMAHEYAHSWNGKHRRPVSLATKDFLAPMHGDLLWVYEGLTQYLGLVLAARSGLVSADHAYDWLAATESWLGGRAGRQWRPLADTAVAAANLYGAPGEWADWRRSVDFYAEGELLWLEVDALIRQKTGGARSLDDFCRRFHGAQPGAARVHAYRLEDVLAALADTAPHDWRAFFDARVYRVAPRPPQGLAAAGWRVAHTSAANKDVAFLEKDAKLSYAAFFSLGLSLKEDGTINDVRAVSPAYRAGLGPGMKVLGVGGRRLSTAVLKDALAATTRDGRGVEILAENGDRYRVYRLEYRGGERYPHLERDRARPDLLTAVLAPRVK
ncbi:MAG TPA: M61 family peptidase [Polyangia bacterium]|jgi:predicted metalloprotease with PDZ domain